jgi:hypothetical protein
VLWLHSYTRRCDYDYPSQKSYTNGSAGSPKDSTPGELSLSSDKGYSMSIKRYAIVALIVLSLIGSAYADQKKRSGVLIDNASVSRVKLPTGGDIPNLLDQLEFYDYAVPYVFQKDLNGDGVEDFLIVSAASLCGTGGCPYALVDGKSMRQVGDFFGSPILISDQKINHYPVIQSYSHIGAGSGNFTTYVYDGQKYQVVSEVYLIGESIEELFKGFDCYRRFVPIRDKKGR